MTPSSIGQQTECTKPKPFLCRESIPSIEKNKTRDALNIPLVHKTLDERERHNAATTSNHSTPVDWQDLSLCACQCILDVSGCIWACSYHVVVRPFRDDH